MRDNAKIKGGLFEYIKQHHHNSFEFLPSAIKTMAKGILSPLNFDHISGNIIFDSYAMFAKITCAMNRWIYDKNYDIYRIWIFSNANLFMDYT